MSKINSLFGSMVFGDPVMKDRLPKDVYDALQRTIKTGEPLDVSIANVVANAMKEWAIEKGATHYTHWFQPMTGITAEKHDSFISPAEGGSAIAEFSGKTLVKGEPDASSFPSGGIRATFEARGYTAWDPTSYAFIKDDCLYIPTAFCSYGGEALDKKTPLLRSMEAINRQALRVLKLFGNDDVKAVRTTVGPEQEYFLIDKSVYDRRRDLIFTGRTLFGAPAPKGQELEDHYFGAIKPRVKAFMAELDEELWKLGVLAKTEHNEVAPAQHELAPIFGTTNIACDHNQLTMELLKTVAARHGLVCLLHEKPFDGVNGSGKHNNWSISTDTGVNLLEPGDTPAENAQFLLFLTAVIKSVDDYQDLLRISVASAGNDHRLGANEAPPAIVSVVLGDELDGVLRAIEKGAAYDGKSKSHLAIGVDVLPKLPKDSTDRNRTSPFAFTGNKFEFRMLGSAESIACANIMLNTAVAESLKQFADKLQGEKDFRRALNALIREEIKAHRRVIFNGNGYDDEWIKAAKKRGLLNLPTTPDALRYYLAPKNVKLFEDHGVFNRLEVTARHDIILENYAKAIMIEARTALDMCAKDILPSVAEYGGELAKAISAKQSIGAKPTKYELDALCTLNSLADSLYAEQQNLSALVAAAPTSYEELADYCKDKIIPAMEETRRYADALEKVVDSKYWRFPTYGELLFSVR